MTSSNKWLNSSAFTQDDVNAAFRVLSWVKGEVSGGGGSTAIVTENAQLVRLAKSIRAARDERLQFLPRDIFGEASWDILLSLYIAYHERYPMKMSAVCHESGVPPTTALRWIDRLIELDLVRKRPNPLDARSSFLELSAETAATMTRYLERVLIRGMGR